MLVYDLLSKFSASFLNLYARWWLRDPPILETGDVVFLLYYFKQCYSPRFFSRVLTVLPILGFIRAHPPKTRASKQYPSFFFMVKNLRFPTFLPSNGAKSTAGSLTTLFTSLGAASLRRSALRWMFCHDSWRLNGVMWVKQYHKPPMTGNGKHTTYLW